ncbi:IS1 family transposase [Escherichia coli]
MALVRVQHENWWCSGLHFWPPESTKPVVNCGGAAYPFTIGMLTTDEWGSYARELPKEKHLNGRFLLSTLSVTTLRTRMKRLARRTICFSRSVELHEKVIGAFIENICSTNWSHHPSDKLSLDDYQTEYTAKDFYLILLFFLK